MVGLRHQPEDQQEQDLVRELIALVLGLEALEEPVPELEEQVPRPQQAQLDQREARRVGRTRRRE